MTSIERTTWLSGELVRALDDMRGRAPDVADSAAKANLISFVAYWRSHHGSLSVVRVLDAVADSEIGKAMKAEA